MPASRIAIALSCLGCLTLAACSPPSTPQPETPSQPQTAAARALHAPLDRAKAVEGQVQQAKAAQDRQIEADTQ